MFPFSYKPTAALMPGKDETLFEYWASFSPMAPLFGVKWRFSEMMMPGSVTVEPATRKRPASKRVKTHSPVEEATVMVAAAAEAAVEATVEATEAVVETVETAMEATAEALTPTHATGVADDLSKIKGVGPKMVERLNEAGIVSFAQIAAWSEDEVAKWDAQLGGVAGRISRDDWVAQAKSLMG